MTRPQQRVFASLAMIAHALADARRLELLGQGELHVDGLAARARLKHVNTSRHLRILHRATLVERRREGYWAYYRLAEEEVVAPLLSALSRVGERNNAEIAGVVEAYFRRRDAIGPLTRQELLDRLRRGSATVLDVRPEDEFKKGHIPGALNFPLAQLERRLVDLPCGQEIITYGRGPWCVLSFEAVAMLRRRGHQVRRLEDGFPEWKAAGLPIGLP